MTGRGLVVVGLFVLCALSGHGQTRGFLKFRGDDSVPIPSGDTTVTLMRGNVVFYHNGTVLTCDSAILYNENYAEAFGRVVVNRDSIYIYGDRADVDGLQNLAKVYAPIVKTIDGDMTMFNSQELQFNTQTKIGRFTHGGTITQKDNLIEADEGIYHVDERDIYFVGRVSMRNEEYLLQTDSMGYNFDTEISRFYRPAKIWNKDGDFLSADRGYYDRASDIYHFEKNSYVLTKNQEVFTDTLLYMKRAAIISVAHNAQIHDREQKGYLWGHYGVYWTEDNQAVMSEDPAAMSYDDEAAEPDSVWLRGERLMLHTFPSEWAFTGELAASLVLPSRAELDSMRLSQGVVSTLPRPDSVAPDSLSNWGHLYGADADTTLLERGMRGAEVDSLRQPPLDSLVVEQLPDSLTGMLLDSLAPRPQLDSGQMVRTRPEVPLDSHPPLLADSVLTTVADSLSGETVDKPKTKAELRRERRLAKRKKKILEYAIDQGIITAADTLPKLDTLPAIDTLAVDSLAQVDTLQRDSLQRVFRAIRNVRIFRSDIQAVCDSLLGFSLDSTAHLYIDPVIWNEQNQVTADSIHVYTRNQELLRADFNGTPVMSQWVVDSLFNQLTGERMEAYFTDNKIRLLKALNSPHGYYYDQNANKPGEIGFFADVRAKQEMHFIFDDSMHMQDLKVYVDVESELFPMDKIPDAHTQRLPGFRWLPMLRPENRWAVSRWELRPSQREQTEAIPYPTFRITERIENDKKYFGKEGRWKDRKEKIKVDPAIFGIVDN